MRLIRHLGLLAILLGNSAWAAGAMACGANITHHDVVTPEFIQRFLSECGALSASTRGIQRPGAAARPGSGPVAAPRQAPAALQPGAPAPNGSGCPQVSSLRFQEDLASGRNFLPFNFQHGAYQLPPHAHPSLLNMAEALRRNPGLRLLLVGHADATGSDEINDRLSSLRSTEALQFLRQTNPELVEAGRVLARGAGARELRRDAGPCDAAQRRIEFIFISTI